MRHLLLTACVLVSLTALRTGSVSTTSAEPGDTHQPPEGTSNLVEAQIGGGNPDLVVLGQQILIASGPRVMGYKIDTADDRHDLIRVSESPMLPGIIRSMSVTSEEVVTALGAQGACFLRADGPAIVVTECIATAFPALDVFATKDVVAIAHGRDGVSIFERKVDGAHIAATIDVDGVASAVVGDESHLYAMIDEGFVVIDLADHNGKFETLGEFRTGVPTKASAISLHKDRVLLGVGPQLVAISVADPSRPEFDSVTSLVAIRGGRVIDMFIDDNRVMVATYSSGAEDGGLWSVDASSNLKTTGYLLSEDYITAIDGLGADNGELLIPIVINGLGLGLAMVDDQSASKAAYASVGGSPVSVETDGRSIITAGKGGMIVRSGDTFQEEVRYERLAESAISIEHQGVTEYYVTMYGEGDVLDSSAQKLLRSGSALQPQWSHQGWGAFRDITYLERVAYVAIEANEDRGGVLAIRMSPNGVISDTNLYSTGPRGATVVRAFEGGVAVTSSDGRFGTISNGLTSLMSPPYGQAMDAVVRDGRMYVARAGGATRGGLLRLSIVDGKPAGVADVLALEAPVVSVDADESYLVALLDAGDSLGGVVVVDLDRWRVIGRATFPGDPSEVRIFQRSLAIAAGSGGLLKLSMDAIVGESVVPTGTPPPTPDGPPRHLLYLPNLISNRQ